MDHSHIMVPLFEDEIVLPPMCKARWRNYEVMNDTYKVRELISEYAPHKVSDFDMIERNLKESVLDSDILTFVYCRLSIPVEKLPVEDPQCVILMKLGIETYCLTWRYICISDLFFSYGGRDNSIFISTPAKTEMFSLKEAFVKIFLFFEPVSEIAQSIYVMFTLSGNCLGEFSLNPDMYKNIYDALNIVSFQRILTSVECIDTNGFRFLLKEYGKR